MVRSHSKMTCPAYTVVEAAIAWGCDGHQWASYRARCACLLPASVWKRTFLGSAEALSIGPWGEVDDFDVCDVCEELPRSLRRRTGASREGARRRETGKGEGDPEVGSPSTCRDSSGEPSEGLAHQDRRMALAR